MAIVPVDLDQARRALRRAAATTSGMVRTAGDLGVAVPNSEWTVRDVAVHLVTALGAFARSAGGEEVVLPMPEVAGARHRVAELNARLLQQVGEDDPMVLAKGIEDGVEAFLAAGEGKPSSSPVATPWYGDEVVVGLGPATCLLLGEQVVHGWDMAAALGRPWPMEAATARLVLAGTPSLMPLFVDPEAAAGMHARFDVHIRRGPRFYTVVEDGKVTIEPPSGAVDCHISADPLAFMMVAYGRRGHWGAIASGRLVAWGRRPWLGLAFPGLFLSP